MALGRDDIKRIIELTTENEKIIELFERILTAKGLDAKKDPSIAASVSFGEMQDLDGLLAFGVRVVNNALSPANTHVSAKNAGKGRPLQADRVMLDLEERDVYDDYLTNCEMVLLTYYPNQEHHEELVSDYRILIYILYKRCTMQAFAKNKPLTTGKDKAIWIEVINEFTHALKAQKEIKLKDPDHPLIDTFSTRENLSQELINRVADKEAAKRTIEVNLKYLDELSLNIKRYLLVALSQAVNVEGLSQRLIGIDLPPVLAGQAQVDATLLKWENAVVGKIEKDALCADIKSIVALSTSEKQTTWDLVTEGILEKKPAYRQYYIINKANNDSLKQLYGLLNATRILMKKIGCFSNINDGIGMIPLMLNLLSIEKFDTLLQNHRESVKEITQQCWAIFKLKGLGNELDSSRLEIDNLMKRKLLSFTKITNKDLLNRIANNCIGHMNTLHRLGMILGCSIIPEALLNRDICIRIGIGTPAHTDQPLAITSSSALSINMDQQEQEKMKGKEKEKEKKEKKNKGKEKDKEEGKEKEKEKENKLKDESNEKELKKKKEKEDEKRESKGKEKEKVKEEEKAEEESNEKKKGKEKIKEERKNKEDESNKKENEEEKRKEKEVEERESKGKEKEKIKEESKEKEEKQATLLRPLITSSLKQNNLSSAPSIDKKIKAQLVTHQEHTARTMYLIGEDVTALDQRIHFSYSTHAAKQDLYMALGIDRQVLLTAISLALKDPQFDELRRLLSNEIIEKYRNNIFPTLSEKLIENEYIALVNSALKKMKNHSSINENLLKSTYDNLLHAISQRTEVMEAYFEVYYVNPPHPTFSIALIRSILKIQQLSVHLWRESDWGTLEKITDHVHPAAKKHLLCCIEEKDTCAQFIALTPVTPNPKQDKTKLKESLSLSLMHPHFNSEDQLAILSYFLTKDNDVADMGLTRTLEHTDQGECLTFANHCIKEGFNSIYAQLKAHYQDQLDQPFNEAIKREFKINILSFFNVFLNKKMLFLFERENDKHQKGYFIFNISEKRQFYALLLDNTHSVFDYVHLIEAKANRFLARDPQGKWICLDRAVSPTSSMSAKAVPTEDTHSLVPVQQILSELKQFYNLDDQVLKDDAYLKAQIEIIANLDARITEIKEQAIDEKEEILAMNISERLFIIKSLYRHYEKEEALSLYFHERDALAEEQSVLILDQSETSLDQHDHRAPIHLYIDRRGSVHRLKVYPYEDHNQLEWNKYQTYLFDYINELLLITPPAASLSLKKYFSIIATSAASKLVQLATDKKTQLIALKKAREEKWQAIQNNRNLRGQFDLYEDMAISVNEELNDFKQTPLFLAINQHNQSLIHFLLKQGASVTSSCYTSCHIEIDTSVKATFSPKERKQVYVLNFQLDQTGKKGCLTYFDEFDAGAYQASSKKANFKKHILNLQEKIDAIKDPNTMSREQRMELEHLIMDYHKKTHEITPLNLYLQEMRRENEARTQLFYLMLTYGLREAKPQYMAVSSFDLLNALSRKYFIPPLINHFYQSLEKEKDDLDSLISNMLYAMFNVFEADIKRAELFAAYIHALVKGETSHDYYQLLKDCDEVRHQAKEHKSDSFHRTVKQICKEARDYIDKNGGLDQLNYQYQTYLQSKTSIQQMTFDKILEEQLLNREQMRLTYNERIKRKKLESEKKIQEERLEKERALKEKEEQHQAVLNAERLEAEKKAQEERLEAENQLKAERLEAENQLKAERLEKEKALKEKEEQHQAAINAERLEAEKKAQAERLEKEKALKAERLEAEKTLKEKEEQHQAAINAERLEAEKALKEKEEQHQAVLKSGQSMREELEKENKQSEEKLAAERLKIEKLKGRDKDRQKELKMMNLEIERKLREKDKQHEAELKAERLKWEKEQQEKLRELSITLQEMKKMRAEQQGNKEAAKTGSVTAMQQPPHATVPLTLFSVPKQSPVERITACLQSRIHLTEDGQLTASQNGNDFFAALATALQSLPGKEAWDKKKLLQAAEESRIGLGQFAGQDHITVIGKYFCNIIELDAIYQLTLNDGNITCTKAAKDGCSFCEPSEIEKQIGQVPIIVQDAHTGNYYVLLATNKNVLVSTPTMGRSSDGTDNG